MKSFSSTSTQNQL